MTDTERQALKFLLEAVATGKIATAVYTPITNPCVQALEFLELLEKERADAANT